MFLNSCVVTFKSDEIDNFSQCHQHFMSSFYANFPKNYEANLCKTFQNQKGVRKMLVKLATFLSSRVGIQKISYANS